MSSEPRSSLQRSDSSRSSVFKYVPSRNIRLQKVDFNNNIPKPLYTREQQPPQDHTKSQIGEGEERRLCISKEFQINKEIIRKKFMDPKYISKGNWFFQKYSYEEKTEIREENYNTMERMGVNLPFFVFFEFTYQDTKYIKLFCQEINNNQKKSKL